MSSKDLPQSPASAEGRMKKYRRGGFEAAGSSTLRIAIQQRSRARVPTANMYPEAGTPGGGGTPPRGGGGGAFGGGAFDEAGGGSQGASPFNSRAASPFARP
eukprot:265847-Chlamydomonas_euryale.AAC.4